MWSSMYYPLFCWLKQIDAAGRGSCWECLLMGLQHNILQELCFVLFFVIMFIISFTFNYSWNLPRIATIGVVGADNFDI